MSERGPFCSDPASRRAFDRWRTYLESECGLELSSPDLLLIGTLARAESRLAQLGVDIAREKDVSKRARLVAVEITAQRAFLSAHDAVERALGPRVDVGEAAAHLVEGPAAALAGRVRSVAAGRILRALSGGARLTKGELLKAAGGDKGQFLRALAELEGEALVVREGQGHRGRPYRFRRAS